MDNKDVKMMSENDIYSLILYAIYKCTKDPEYSTLAELIYTLDRKHLVKLCKVFGGCTIKIPTLEELKVYSCGLLVYNLINEGMSLTEALHTTGLDSKDYSKVMSVYKIIEKVADEYENF